MAFEKFDLSRMDRLNDPARFEGMDPDELWAALALPDPAVIVEIGAGTGLFACRFAEMSPTSIVYAVDMEPAMVEWMRENRAEVAKGVLVPVLSTETTVPLSDESADAVIMLNVHHELAEPGVTYAEAARLLRPGGRVLVADFSPEAPGDRPPRHVRVSAQGLEETLASAGFIGVEAHDGLPSYSLLTATKPRP